MARARLGAERGGAHAIDVHEGAAEVIVCMLDVLGCEARISGDAVPDLLGCACRYGGCGRGAASFIREFAWLLTPAYDIARPS